ncbi:hypothetical protein Mapa_006223 [Marchantia paleacea]|nr:hypothetical protein Mapa_006223 [Marchantia paleacea]
MQTLLLNLSLRYLKRMVVNFELQEYHRLTRLSTNDPEKDLGHGRQAFFLTTLILLVDRAFLCTWMEWGLSKSTLPVSTADFMSAPTAIPRSGTEVDLCHASTAGASGGGQKSAPLLNCFLTAFRTNSGGVYPLTVTI